MPVCLHSAGLHALPLLKAAQRAASAEGIDMFCVLAPATVYRASHWPAGISLIPRLTNVCTVS